MSQYLFPAPLKDLWGKDMAYTLLIICANEIMCIGYSRYNLVYNLGKGLSPARRQSIT